MGEFTTVLLKFRFLYAANVVILLIFFCSFHNDTRVVSISKTVSIDANYLLKLETFLIDFDEGKGGQFFPGEKRIKMVKSREFINIFFCFLSRHKTESKRTESA